MFALNKTVIETNTVITKRTMKTVIIRFFQSKSFKLILLIDSDNPARLNMPARDKNVTDNIAPKTNTKKIIDVQPITCKIVSFSVEQVVSKVLAEVVKYMYEFGDIVTLKEVLSWNMSVKPLQ